MSALTVIDSLGISLDEITNFYLDQHQLPQSKFDRISRLAIRGYRLFYRDSTGCPKTVTLSVQANNTSVLPVDAMNKISVGVLNARGEIASLTYDPLLALTDVESSTRLEQQVDPNLIITNQAIILSYPETLGGLQASYGYGQFGIGSQPVLGFYNIDWQQRTIVYNFGFMQTEVIFSYLGLYDNNGEYYIHPFFQEALIAFIEWQDLKGNPKSTLGEKAQAKRDYDIQYNNARKSMTPFDPSDMYNVTRQGARLSPKS